MQKEHLRNLQPFKTAAAYGGGFGIIILIFSLLGYGYNNLLGIGIGLTAASVVLFLFGTFLCLMEEYTVAAKGKAEMAESSKGF
ncbi:hypothetical protein [Neobacillus soli]|uniref:hypothetical protein n=1 Tax=Neobacillus soli TaxID=220688 RepID=UPI000826F40D|nr:hypothetical protein [Neobacillus soli]